MLAAKFKKIAIIALLSLSVVLLSKANFEHFGFHSHLAIASVKLEQLANGDRVNVRDFGAKGDGVSDDTQAIQKAIDSVVRNFADENTRDFRTVYFPQGVYLVSNTIQLGRTKTIQGEDRQQTIIRLQDDNSEYAQIPKAVLRSFFNNNQTFGIYIKDLTVNVGKGNPQAIGIQYNTHNSGAIENVTITSEDFAGAIGLDLSETEFGPGMIKNLTVEGFDTGIKTPHAPSNAVFSQIKLKRQNVVGWENNMPISVEGLKSENSVPAIYNSSHPLAHLVLIDAELIGLPSESSSKLAAIKNEGAYYLRQIRAKGSYISALDDRGSTSSKKIDEQWSNLSSNIKPSQKGHLKLPIEEPPQPYLESIENWTIPDGSQDDDTQAIQTAMDSGAKTIFFPGNITYNVSQTIRVPSTVRHIIGQQKPIVGTQVFTNRPMFDLVGKTTESVTIENLHISAWPNSIVGFEIDSNRPVYIKYSGDTAIKSTIATTENWSGKVYIDEWGGNLRINGTGSVWIRQWNPENNPFRLGESDPKVTYGINNGAKLWVLGTKTEAPAIHVLTKNGGKTELIGGFFRDHFSPDEYQPEVPYLITQNASVSASYLQYASNPGKARKLQAVENQNSQTKKIVTKPELLTVELYQSRI